MNAPEPDLDQERWQLATTIDRVLEWPLVILAVAWIALLVIELVRGLTPALERAGLIIWGVFVAEFLLRFVIAPRKIAFLRTNWLTVLSLVLPAVRALRVFRIARAVRGIRLVRIVSSINRSMNSVGSSLRRRGLPYVAALTLFVLITGAAGMYAFEAHTSEGALDSYGDALWWTAMLLTTMGSDYWPRTLEGRLLAVFLSLYALGILGYIAGTLATFFIGKDRAEAERAH